MRIGIMTLSDAGARGERPDESGPAIAEMLAAFAPLVIRYEILPDEAPTIAAALAEWADRDGLAAIFTTGGTGLGPRDVTPEATRSVIAREVPGMAEAMRTAGLAHTPMAMLSRGVVGARGATLIINLPGSPKGVRESLEVLLPVLPHALKLLAGDTAHRPTDRSTP